MGTKISFGIFFEKNNFIFYAERHIIRVSLNRFVRRCFAACSQVRDVKEGVSPPTFKVRDVNDAGGCLILPLFWKKNIVFARRFRMEFWKKRSGFMRNKNVRVVFVPCAAIIPGLKLPAIHIFEKMLIGLNQQPGNTHNLPSLSFRGRSPWESPAPQHRLASSQLTL